MWDRNIEGSDSCRMYFIHDKWYRHVYTTDLKSSSADEIFETQSGL